MEARLIRAAGRARIERAGNAYLVCTFVATALVAAVAVFFTLWNVVQGGRLAEFDFGRFVWNGTFIWLVISVIGLIVAGPFVTLATWLGARFRLENALYYALTGGGAAGALILPIFGLPHQTDFGSSIAAWSIAPPCGVMWGLAWWYLHRRWRARSREGPSNAA